MPKEIVNDVMRYSSAYDFMKEYKKMYPSHIYVMSGEHYVEVECKTAYGFALIRKKLIKAWDINVMGPKIDQETSEGTFQRPLDITDLGIPLSDFKLLNMILSDKDHTQIKNLTAQKVKELDDWVVKLKLDINRWLYIGRTRLGDETGSQIEVIYHGQDRVSLDVNKPYDLDDGFNKRSIVGGKVQHSYYDSLTVDMPTNMTWVTFHKTYHGKPPDNTSMSSFFF